MAALPEISTLPTLPTAYRARVLDTLFEPSTQLHTLSVSTLRDNTYLNYASLISAIGDQLTALLDSSSTSDSEWLDAILSAHPRLGEKNVDSELSRGEQAQLQDQDEDGDLDNLAELNRKYETTFPGLRYVSVSSICFRSTPPSPPPTLVRFPIVLLTLETGCSSTAGVEA